MYCNDTLETSLKAASKIAVMWLIIPASCIAGWTESVWPASNHSPRELVYAYGQTNYARDVWIMDCWSGMVERAYAIGSTSEINNIMLIWDIDAPFNSTNVPRSQPIYMRAIKSALYAISSSYLAASDDSDYGLTTFFLNPAGVASNADGYPSRAYGWSQGFVGNLYSAANLGNGWETNVVYRDHNEMTTNNPGYGWDSVRRVITNMTLTFGGAATIRTNQYEIYSDGGSGFIYNNPYGSGGCATPPTLDPCANPSAILTGGGTVFWPFQNESRNFTAAPVGFCGNYGENSWASKNVKARSRFGASMTTNLASKIVGVQFFRWSYDTGSYDDAADGMAGSYKVIAYDGTYEFQTNAYTAISEEMHTSFDCSNPSESLLGTIGLFYTYAVSQVIVKWDFEYD